MIDSCVNFLVFTVQIFQEIFTLEFTHFFLTVILLQKLQNSTMQRKGGKNFFFWWLCDKKLQHSRYLVKDLLAKMGSEQS